MKTFLFALALLGLSACSEKPQALAHSSNDASAYSGTGSAFMSPDWKAGDKAAWESRLKAREQYSQNDYTRMN
jgi:starvation-inducible outer membrane lipoprotein